MAEFMIITVDTGKAVCNTSKWQSITGIVNMTKFQPGLSQGIYEALAWEGLIGTVAWDALSEAEQKSLQQIVDFNNNGGEL
jgi:hypothetical protein